MASTHPQRWEHKPIRTLDIVLDALNPRIDVQPTATQEQIREALCATENIVDLAASIAHTGGQMAGERIIVLEENGKCIVAEGNRRTCACQMLLDSSLIPANLKGKIPAVSAAVKEIIEELLADVAPTREAAEIIITRRHTESGIEKWTPMANYGRLGRLLNSGATIEKISAESGASIPKLKKLQREMMLMERTKDLASWSPTEKALLNSPTSKPNAFTRFFTLKGVAKHLPINYGPEGAPQTTLPKKAFNESLEFPARKFLMSDAASGEPEFDTGVRRNRSGGFSYSKRLAYSRRNSSWITLSTFSLSSVSSN